MADCPAMFGYQRVQAAIQPLGQAGAVGGWRGAGAEDDDDDDDDDDEYDDDEY